MGYSPSLDNYSLDWNPPFGGIPPPLPSSTVPWTSGSPAPGARPPASATRGEGLGTPHSAFQNGRGGGVSPPLPIRLLPSQNGRGGGPLFSQVRVVPEHTIGATRGSVPVLWHGGPPGQRAARDGYSRPWAPG